MTWIKGVFGYMINPREWGDHIECCMLNYLDILHLLNYLEEGIVNYKFVKADLSNKVLY